VRREGFKVVLDYFGAASSVLPSVLARMGADVLSINPYAATTSIDDHRARVTRVEDLVRTSGSALGIVFDPDGETLVVVDDEGRALSHEHCLLTLVTLLGEAQPGARLALPVTASREAERIASAAGCSVTWTKLSAGHLMEVANQGGIDFAGSQEGGYMWPDFLPAYDAVATLAKLLDLLAATGRSLSSVTRELPRVHVAHQVVPTPWERKGGIMRETLTQAKDLDLVLVDGVKVLHPDGWALVVPDPEDPVTHVWAEGDTDQAARQLAQEYARRIRHSLREH
jgi:mannose-1-phosphate guanylyltransferase/phosphomannomutase